MPINKKVKDQLLLGNFWEMKHDRMINGKGILQDNVLSLDMRPGLWQ